MRKAISMQSGTYSGRSAGSVRRLGPLASSVGHRGPFTHRRVFNCLRRREGAARRRPATVRSGLYCCRFSLSSTLFWSFSCVSWESVICGRVACERGAWLGLESSVYIRTTPMFMWNRIRLAGDSIHNVGGAWACQGGSRDGVKSSQVKNVKSLQYINLRVDFFCS